MNRDLPKLVRDNCQELYPDNVYSTSDRNLLQILFERKVKEELEEVQEAITSGDYQKIVEEFADLQQVIKDFATFSWVHPDDIEQVRKKKEEHRGGFLAGLVLEECTLWQDTSHIST
jgi:predicted house-cleaning noncanonical NTP pyrophosphatase (MazG superfamily)